MNNTVESLWYQGTLPPRNGIDAQGNIVNNATIYALPAGQPLPPAAQAIVDASGARSSRNVAS